MTADLMKLGIMFEAELIKHNSGKHHLLEAQVMIPENVQIWDTTFDRKDGVKRRFKDI